MPLTDCILCPHFYLSLLFNLFGGQLTTVSCKNHYFIFFVPRHIVDIFRLYICLKNFLHKSIDPNTLDVDYFFEMFEISDHYTDVDFS
jgi:hypothetical protein